jgi:hypothetical protein
VRGEHLGKAVVRFDWPRVIGRYDREFERAAAQ